MRMYLSLFSRLERFHNLRRIKPNTLRRSGSSSADFWSIWMAYSIPSFPVHKALSTASQRPDDQWRNIFGHLLIVNYNCFGKHYCIAVSSRILGMMDSDLSNHEDLDSSCHY